MERILAPAYENVHAHRSAVAPEHSHIAVLKRDYRAVKNAVGYFVPIPADNGILAVTPQG